MHHEPPCSIACRQLARHRRPVKLVKPSSTVHKPATFTLLPAASENTCSSHPASHAGPHASRWAAKDIWPQAQAGLPRHTQGRAAGAPPRVVAPSLYMHGPHADVMTSNFHWASYSMATGEHPRITGNRHHARTEYPQEALIAEVLCMSLHLYVGQGCCVHI